MKNAKKWMNKLLRPPVWVLCTVPPVVYGLLIYLFATDRAEGTLANIVFGLSAYSLVILCFAIPQAIAGYRAWKEDFLANSPLIRRLSATRFGARFIHSLAFRGSVSIYRGMFINFLYVIFRGVTGVLYGSVWFLSMAAYYLALGLLRTYLSVCYRRAEAAPSAAYEYGCYRKTGWLLFLLNIPMGGMILLMVTTNSGFVYPGYVIYASAIYTFLIFGLSIKNLFRFRKLGSPILSAAMTLNFVAAVMSVLGLQTAMIASFSTSGEQFRITMNTITGTAVFTLVIGAAVYMLCSSSRQMRKIKEACQNEPIREQIL